MTDDKQLAEAYRETEERDRRVYEQWEGASREANALLDDAPAVTPDPDHPRGENIEPWEPGDGEES